MANLNESLARILGEDAFEGEDDFGAAKKKKKKTKKPRRMYPSSLAVNEESVLAAATLTLTATPFRACLIKDFQTSSTGFLITNIEQGGHRLMNSVGAIPSEMFSGNNPNKVVLQGRKWLLPNEPVYVTVTNNNVAATVFYGTFDVVEMA